MIDKLINRSLFLKLCYKIVMEMLIDYVFDNCVFLVLIKIKWVFCVLMFCGKNNVCKG